MSTTQATDAVQPARVFRYQPALDGVRAIAVTMVLLFHAGVPGFAGGYFGVSVFFTLSGFLITALLVRETDASQRVDVGAFYTRRLKRLLPASLVCLVGVCVLGAFDVWTGVSNLRRDVLGAAFQVANWVQLLAGESYTDLQSHRAGIISPLDHYWSLAIEEQFYWIWPIAFMLIARAARRRNRGMTASLVVTTIVFAAAAPVIAAVWGTDAAYWASPARAAEILIGAVLAVALFEGRIHPTRWMAPFGLVGVIVLGIVLPATGGPGYHGWFAPLAMFSGVLILGVQRPGPVRRLLGAAPFAATGRVSYGLYLFHFPVFVALDDNRIGFGGPGLFAIRIAVTVAITLVSYHFIERPIRYGTFSPKVVFSGALTATAAAACLVLIVPAAAESNYFQPDQRYVDAAGIDPVSDGSLAPLVVGSGDAASGGPTAVSAAGTTATSDSPSTDTSDSPSTSLTPETTAVHSPAPTRDPDPAPTTTDPFESMTLPELSRPVRVLVLGDSTALAIGAGLVKWAAEHPEIMQVELEAVVGCPFLRGGQPDGDPFAATCDHHLDDEVPGALMRLQPDIVMMMATVGDVEPRTWETDEGTLVPTDAGYRAHLVESYEAISNVILTTTAARIAWVRPPLAVPYWYGTGIDSSYLRVRDSAMRDAVAWAQGRAELLDLEGYVAAVGLDDDVDARPDGLHFTEDAAYEISAGWLGPRLVIAAIANI